METTRITTVMANKSNCSLLYLHTLFFVSLNLFYHNVEAEIISDFKTY